MEDRPVHDLIADIPPGGWAVGVSGGADSVAALALLRGRGDIHVAHLDHQLRGEESAGDARFVEELCRQWQIPYTIGRRKEIEPLVHENINNPSARYRRLRLELFRQVIQQHHLKGVILAHHQDDQIETVLLRMMRSGTLRAAAGMARDSVVRGVHIHRPFLGVPRETLRQYLIENHIPWREDSSNTSDRYARNRIRKWLAHHPHVGPHVLKLSRLARQLKQTAASMAPEWAEAIPIRQLADLPEFLADESLRKWLAMHGIYSPKPDLIAAMIHMAGDLATPSRMNLPGGRRLVRRAGKMQIE